MKNSFVLIIDSDYSKGEIINSNFDNIDGDAIDTSGSAVKIKMVNISNVGDKGISVGERSDVEAKQVSINNTNIGIASKDSSQFFGSNLIIKNSRKYDLASYNKKKVFDGGNMKIEKIISNNKHLVQKNSEIIINNKNIIEKEFNSKELY